MRYESREPCMMACMHAQLLSHVRLFATLWTVDPQAPPSMGFSSKNTGVCCHALLQGLFLTQGLKLCVSCLLHWQADSYHWVTWEALNTALKKIILILITTTVLASRQSRMTSGYMMKATCPGTEVGRLIKPLWGKIQFSRTYTVGLPNCLMYFD